MKFMEVIRIPAYTDKYARWKVSVNLSGVRYQLYISWNTRIESWYMTILDVNDKILLGGLRLVPNVLLLEKYRASVPELPIGDLVIFDREGNLKADEITRKNLGSRFDLSYVISGE
jgi:hypothetical protein